MQKVVLLFLLMALPALVKSLRLTRFNGTISVEMLSNSTDKSLTIDQCNIEAIEDGALCSSPFKIISFPWNFKLPEIFTKEMFGECPNLTFLKIDHWNNPHTARWTFERDAFAHLTSLKYIFLIGAVNTEIGKDNLLLPPSLLKFHARRMKSLVTLKLDVFDGLTRLESVWLGDSFLERAEGSFDKLPAVKEVIFSETYLSEPFPWKAFKNLENLEIIRLSHTGVKADNVDEVFENVPKLKELNLGELSVKDCLMIRKLDKEFKSKFGRQDVTVKYQFDPYTTYCEKWVYPKYP